MDRTTNPLNLLSEQHLDFVLKTAKLGLWNWDICAGEVRWSDSIEHILGVKANTINGSFTTYLKLIHKDDRRDVINAIRDTLKSSQDCRIIHRVQPQGANLRWVYGQGYLFRDSRGQPVNMAGVVMDITQQKNSERQLIESEERFRAFTEASQEAICFSEHGRIVDFNPALGEMLGYAAAELLDADIGKFVAPQDRELVSSRVRTNSDSSYEHRALCKNGSIIHVEAYGKNIEFKGKKCRMTALHDITARKQAELALQNSQMLLSSIIDNSPSLIFLKDTHGRYMLANKQFRELLHIPSDQLIGETGTVHFDARVSSRLQDTDSVVLKNKAPHEFEITIPTQKGDTRIFHAVKFPLLDGNGEIYGIGGIANDITEKKQAENVLLQRDQMIRDIVETSNDWFWAADENGVLNYTNPAVFETLGYRPEEILNKTGYEFIHPDDIERARKIFSQAFARRTGWKNIHMRWKCRNGGYRILESKSVPIVDDNGQLRGFRASERDVTDRIAMESEKEKLEQQLRQSQKMEAVGQLAGGIAHDFNNILTVILGHTELAGLTLNKENPNKSLLQNDLNEIHQSAQRAAVLTSQLLAFSRRQVSKPQVLNINHIIMDMESMLRRLISEDIALHLSTNSNLKNINIDPNQLQQVIMNLVINARDAISDNGTITIETNNVDLDNQFIESHSGSQMGSNVRLTISDTGCGMDKETMQRIFEPFFSTKPAGQGTGLGLSMVYGIVKQAGGYITVYSEPGSGTSVKIYFPVSEAGLSGEIAKPESTAEYSGGTETILVCEDDETVRALTVNILRNSGYNVLQAEQAEPALDIARNTREHISLLVTDLIMPGMNGQKLSIAIGRIIPEIKTLYLSGYTADTISDYGIIGRDTEFLQKPFSRNDLLQQIRRILDQA